jgi:hypothetical protein
MGFPMWQHRPPRTLFTSSPPSPQPKQAKYGPSPRLQPGRVVRAKSHMKPSDSGGSSWKTHCRRSIKQRKGHRLAPGGPSSTEDPGDLSAHTEQMTAGLGL